VTPADVPEFMRPMPVEKLYGVGPKTASALRDEGIVTIGDLARADLALLDRLFGQKSAVYLRDAANGTDEEPVVESASAKQVSRMITLKHDSRDLEDIITQLSPAIEDVHRRVLEKGLFFRSISAIGILTDLSIKTRSKTLEVPINDPVSLKRVATELFSSLLTEGQKNLRRAGIRVSDFSEAKAQSSLAEFIG
jgi:nucleotidyltransferase/DNA polymerase involved in DNA repair